MQLEAVGEENDDYTSFMWKGLSSSLLGGEGAPCEHKSPYHKRARKSHMLTEQISHKITTQIKSRGGLGF